MVLLQSAPTRTDWTIDANISLIYLISKYREYPAMVLCSTLAHEPMWGAIAMALCAAAAAKGSDVIQSSVLHPVRCPTIRLWWSKGNDQINKIGHVHVFLLWLPLLQFSNSLPRALVRCSVSAKREERLVSDGRTRSNSFPNGRTTIICLIFWFGLAHPAMAFQQNQWTLLMWVNSAVGQWNNQCHFRMFHICAKSSWICLELVERKWSGLIIVEFIQTTKCIAVDPETTNRRVCFLEFRNKMKMENFRLKS